MQKKEKYQKTTIEIKRERNGADERKFSLSPILTQNQYFLPISYSNLAHNDSFSSLSRYKKNGADFGFFYYLWGKFGANFMYCFVIS
jgi:hypothetical protein